MEKKTKVFIGKIKSVDEEKKTVEVIVSDGTIDRYGEVILPEAFSKRLGSYKKGNPVLLSSHNYGKLTNIIGKATNIKVTDEGLLAKFLYFAGDGNEEADWAWKLASKYKMAAFSVGFMPWEGKSGDWEKDADAIKAGKKPNYVFTDVELLEVSQVCVPANPSAVMKSLEDGIEGIDDITREIVTEYAKSVIQAIENDKSINDDLEIKELEDDDVKEIIEALSKKFDDMNAIILGISQYIEAQKQAEADKKALELELVTKAEEEARIKAEEEAATLKAKDDEKKPCSICGVDTCDGTCGEKEFDDAILKFLWKSTDNLKKFISTQS